MFVYLLRKINVRTRLNQIFRFKFDDGRVAPVMYSEILDSYGGEFSDANSISAIDPTDKRSRSTNAYMLIYIRESNINEILSPVISEDIPDHLRMYLQIYLIKLKIVCYLFITI